MNNAGTRRDPVLIVLVTGLAIFAGAFGFVACSEPASPAKMTFAECQKSAEYPGGRYAVEYDNGICTVQR